MGGFQRSARSAAGTRPRHPDPQGPCHQHAGGRLADRVMDAGSRGRRRIRFPGVRHDDRHRLHNGLRGGTGVEHRQPLRLPCHFWVFLGTCPLPGPCAVVGDRRGADRKGGFHRSRCGGHSCLLVGALHTGRLPPVHGLQAGVHRAIRRSIPARISRCASQRR